MKINTLQESRYKIQQQLSSKAGRITYLAEDTHSQDLVVIKVLLFGSIQWEDVKLFEREANTLKNLDHPAIPKYLDYFEIDEDEIKGFALVQTYINATSLQKTVEQGRKFSEQELRELAQKLLDILHYLHQQIPPVIHRDIKPSNILISNRSAHSVGDVYLVDFGSVQTVANKNSGTITIVGTFGYMPQEQFIGKTTKASDLYSLGMTLIYLITGVHPAELIQDDGRIKLDEDLVSSQFRRWLEKMTSPYPKGRLKSADLAKFSLKVLDGESSEYTLNTKPHNGGIKLYKSNNYWEDGGRLLRQDYNTLNNDRQVAPLASSVILLFLLIAIFSGSPGIGILLLLIPSLTVIFFGINSGNE